METPRRRVARTSSSRPTDAEPGDDLAPGDEPSTPDELAEEARDPDAPALPALRRPRRGGLGSAMLAGALSGLRDALEDKPDETIPAVVDSPTDPTDIDVDGVTVDAHDQRFHSPAPPPILTRKPRRPTTKGKAKAKGRASGKGATRAKGEAPRRADG